VLPGSREAAMRKPLLSTLLVSLLVLASSACTLGPDYLRPPLETPTAWRVSEKDAGDLANTPWWEQFADPVLNDLVHTALRENKDLLLAAARVDEFAGRYGFVRAAQFPQLGGGFTASRQRNTIPGTGGPTVFDSYQATLSATWEIDFWGRLRRQSEAARAQLLASEEGRRSVILSLIASVAGAYINLRELDRELEISRATAHSRAQSYAVFRERFAGGVISILELSQNQSQYEEALATIPLLEKAIAQQENGLSVLLGRNPGPLARGRTIEQLALPAWQDVLGAAEQLVRQKPAFPKYIKGTVLENDVPVWIATFTQQMLVRELSRIRAVIASDRCDGDTDYAAGANAARAKYLAAIDKR